MATQEELTNAIDSAIKQCEEEYPVECNNHQHICTFKLLGEKVAKKCDAWRAQHPIKFPDKWHEPTCREDYCGFCEMMNYICLDDEGRIVYVTRTHPDRLRFYFNHKSET